MHVDAPPPARHDPGRCADRTSPNAWPLFEAASAIVNDDAARFPITGGVRLSVTSSGPLPDHEDEGYGPTEAIIEILVEAGVLADERQVETERHEVHRGMTGYEVTVAEPGVR